MSYRPVLIVCAEGIIIDGDSNLISAFNIIEDVTPAGYPFLIPRVGVLSAVARDITDPARPPNCSFQFDLDGEVIFQTAIEIDFLNLTRHRSRLMLGGLVLPRPGMLTVRALVDGVVIQSCQVGVKPAINPAGIAGPVPAAPGNAG